MKVEIGSGGDWYAKRVTGFDPSHASGWAVAGDFLHVSRAGTIADAAGLVLAHDRSSREARIYFDGRIVATFAPVGWDDVCHKLETMGVARVEIVPTRSTGRRRRRRSTSPSPTPSPEGAPAPDAPRETVKAVWPRYDADVELTAGDEIAVEDLVQIDRERWPIILGEALRRMGLPC